MRRYGPAVLLALTGAAVLRISLFGELYLRYVQPGLRPYLIVSGAVLVLLAVATALTARRPATDAQDAHGHGHGPAGPRVAWLLTLPALALLLFPPPALGSYSAEREAARRAAQGVGTFPALPSGDPVELTLAEFGSRAIYDSARSLTGRTVRLTGFVTHGDDGTWYVTRLQVSCCAADATTGKAEIRGRAAADAPPTDTWVTVTGTWHPEGGLGTDAAWPPVLDATDVRRVAQPANPYEKR
ncbi:membrane protein [Streptomyces viridiviolaceus]|uniref:TIGR03943 family putative permease subunit n=1 Tax=Streptomyces viridiviolaceus TaxID=68282 RepID=A0ABW2DZ89_9ACTN|nr:TIGR03943 family protein [Streptomyces viridiviolaceus]GHB24153.1 membrane protein [Streptomyces viridiviolaceus]